MYIGSIKTKGIAALAPMAGVTDRAFREICAMFGVSYLVSEMISIKGIIYNDKKTLELADNSQSSIPFAIQLFGRDPNDFHNAVEIISKFKPDIIDINMGCPAPKIIKSGAGSALMNDPKLCGQIVKSVKNNCNLPVTVKIRAGFDNNHITAINVAKECEYHGADAITIHGRTRQQMYSGTVNLDIIKEVKSAAKIPVIANGDICSYNQAKYTIDYTGCDTVSIGRGALGNPWIFKNINSLNNDYSPNIKEKIHIMKLHIDKLILYKGESRGMKEARKHLAWYIKGFNGASSIRKEIVKMNTKDDFYKICNIILDCNS